MYVQWTPLEYLGDVNEEKFLLSSRKYCWTKSFVYRNALAWNNIVHSQVKHTIIVVKLMKFAELVHLAMNHLYTLKYASFLSRNWGAVCHNQLYIELLFS